MNIFIHFNFWRRLIFVITSIIINLIVFIYVDVLRDGTPNARLEISEQSLNEGQTFTGPAMGIPTCKTFKYQINKN